MNSLFKVNIEARPYLPRHIQPLLTRSESIENTIHTLEQRFADGRSSSELSGDPELLRELNKALTDFHEAAQFLFPRESQQLSVKFANLIGAHRDAIVRNGLALHPPVVESLLKTGVCRNSDVAVAMTGEQKNRDGALLSGAFTLIGALPGSGTARSFLRACLEWLQSRDCDLNARWTVPSFEGDMALVELAVAFGAPAIIFRDLRNLGVDLVRRDKVGESFIQAYRGERFAGFIENIAAYIPLFEVAGSLLLDNQNTLGHVLLDRLSCHVHDPKTSRWRSDGTHMNAAETLIRAGANPLLSRRLPLRFSKDRIAMLSNPRCGGNPDDARIQQYLQLLESTVPNGHFFEKHYRQTTCKCIAIEVEKEQRDNANHEKPTFISRSLWKDCRTLFDVLEFVQTDIVFANLFIPLHSSKKYAVVSSATSGTTGCMTDSLNTSDAFLFKNLVPKGKNYVANCVFYVCTGFEVRLSTTSGNGPPPTLPFTAFPMQYGELKKFTKSFEVSNNNWLVPKDPNAKS
jgi:hypothetical protein